MNRLILFILLFGSMKAGAQAVGCISLEGLKLPCFGGGVACGSCESKYTEEERRNACVGTLPLSNPSGCGGGGTCGTKCCTTCSQYNPADYYTCQTLPGACDENGNFAPCGSGTKVASCEESSCASQAANRCGTYSCSCGITCQGTKQMIRCYRWTSKPVPSGGSCGCRNVGATPGRCAGAPTGASECGGVPNPCNGDGSQCTGASNRCYVCSYSPGNPGTCSPTCNVGSASCYENPTPVDVCASSCSGGGLTDNPNTPPGASCSSVPGPACTDNSCPSCGPSC